MADPLGDGELGSILDGVRRVHLVGIGGIGLSAIARVLIGRGYVVSGSDAQRSRITEQLSALGADVSTGHARENVRGSDLVIVSSAVPRDNVEIAEARAQGIPVVKRDAVLGPLLTGRIGIAVAGTHGKTTTASMTAFVLSQAGLDPSFIIGGVLRDLGTNARHGSGPHFVVEADEYDYAFLGLRPEVAVVTAIDMDHPDCFSDIKAMSSAFERFVCQVAQGGAVVGCADHPRVASLLASVSRSDGPRVITYGFSPSSDWRARSVLSTDSGGMAFVVTSGGQDVGACELQLPGVHNVANALACVAALSTLDLAIADCLSSLRLFRGVGRRFELKGESGGVTVVDDYAHHPTQIEATLSAARQRYGRQQLWALFQPHTYTRTRTLLDEFARSFGLADHVIVSDIYAARERENPGVSAEELVSRIKHPDARHMSGLAEIAEYLAGVLRPGDVLLTLGAGDGYRVGEMVLNKLGEHHGARALCSSGAAK